MSTLVTVAGQSFTVPATGEYNFGDNVSNLLIKLSTSTAVLQSTSTTFTLSAGDVDLGGSYGLKSLYYKSRASNPSSTGQIRLGNAESIGWRNAGNSADLLFKLNASNRLEVDGVTIPTISSTDTLTNKSISLGSNTLTGTSAQMATAISDKTGSAGALVFSNSPTIATPTITTSATVPLVIGGTGTTSTLTLRSTSGVGTTNADIIFQVGNNGATEAMRILNSGAVGIGTNAPSSPLEIYNATAAGLTLRGDASVSQTIQRSSTNASEPTMSFYKTRGTNASPTTVASSDALGTLYFNGYGGTNIRNLAFVRSLVGTYTSDSNISSYLSFGTSPSGSAAATEVMRIDSAGNVGIGMTPSKKVDITTASNNGIQVTDGTTTGILFPSTLNTNSFAIGASSNHPTILLSNNTIRVTVAATGEVGVGLTPTSRNNTTFQIKDGIGFPAAQVASSDANTLDDYEEGTFTPTLTATSGTITTVGTTVGRYTKIGNNITVLMYLPITTNGTAAALLKVSNLPFTVNNSVAPIGSTRELAAVGIPGVCWADTSTTNCYLCRYDGTYPGGSGYGLGCSITYQTT